MGKVRCQVNVSGMTLVSAGIPYPFSVVESTLVNRCTETQRFGVISVKSQLM